MEWLVSIGTGIVGKLVEYTVEPVIRQVSYVIFYNRNLKRLQKQVDDLGDARKRVQHAVETEENNGRKIEDDVLTWLTEVDNITEEAKHFLEEEHHARFCPILKFRHQRSRRSTKMAQDIIELHTKKDFSGLAYKVKPQEVCTISAQDYEAFDSRSSTVKQIINQLRDSNTYMIGLYGMGGVGKTTLVKEVYRQVAADGKMFEEVVMVLDLKQNPSIERIQKEVAEKLGLELSENDTPAAKARHLCNRIKDKNTLVILDDVWETIDLEAVGLPRMATLKIFLTSRSKIVLSKEMGTQKEFPLDVLDREEAWNLFQNMAGDTVKKSDIRSIATQVADKCGGLPILIVTVAKDLRNSPLHVWKDTLRRLKRLDGQELTEKVYSALEWSYNRLENEELKTIFLLCEFIPKCKKVDLWKYSMGLDLLKHVDTMGEAWDAFNSMLEILIDSNLLLDSDTFVKMHDIVRDVAKRITSRERHAISLARGDELKEWPDEDFCKKCAMISLKQCSIPKLPEVLECRELILFQIHSAQDDWSLEIPCNFFKAMKKLRVLDLTHLSIPSLPSSFIFLRTLRMLCLDRCTLEDLSFVGQLQNLESLSFLKSKFKMLPKEIAELTRLRLLDLTGCSQLEVISPNVLSSLKRLEHLRMANSFKRWEAEGVTSTERSNANLGELKHLHQLTLLQIHIPDANKIPADLFPGKLEKYQICIGSVWKWSDVDENLNALKLQLSASNKLDQGLKMLLKTTEDLYLEGMEGIDNNIIHQLGIDVFRQLKRLHVQNNAGFAYIINGKANFPNLTWLAVSQLNSSRFLLSSSMVRSLANLKHLQISGCQIMEEIVSMDESDEIAENMFFQLQNLELKDLPNLTKFRSSCCTELPNPSSERLQLEDRSRLTPVVKDNTTCEKAEERNSKGDLETVIQHFLFDNKVEFPNLKMLSIDGLAKLKSIWSNQFTPVSSKNLVTVKIVSCGSLKSIFPVSVATSLQQLRSLTVWNCDELEEIVSYKDGLQTAPVFEFPMLTNIRFENLPQLRSFYPGLHTSNWPSLKELMVYECDNVKIFKVGKHELNSFYTPNEQSLFSFEKDSFPNVYFLGLDVQQSWDSPPLYSLRNLRELYVYAQSNTSVDSLEKLLGLEKINVSSGEIHAVESGTLILHLRELQLSGMRKLMHLGDDSYRSAVAHFPNLELLVLEECDSLKNLRSSAISFKTLVTLQVSFCKGLKYLVTYSIARSLAQLRKLEVENCKQMTEIVASSEDHDSTIEVEFKQLKQVKLSALPRLLGFCSGTCIVKFPSLESLSMSSCTQLDTFIFDAKRRPKMSIEQSEDSNFLFDKKVEFPNLKSLSIDGAKKLTTVWHSQLAVDSFCRLSEVKIHECENVIKIFAPSMMGRLNALHTLSVTDCKSVQVVFEHETVGTKDAHDTSAGQINLFECRNLQVVRVNSCESLKTIFPVSVARILQQLQELSVTKCGVEEIVANTERRPQALPSFTFPKVIKVLFRDLPQLRSLYPGNHVSKWPSLNNLVVQGCDKVDILAEEISSFDGNLESNCSYGPTKQSLFLIQKDSFPNLEKLVLNGTDIWNGRLPMKFFSKLKSLVVANLECKSVVFLDKLQVDLEAGNTGSSSNSAVGTGTHGQLTHLRHLEIIKMHNLMHLGEDNSQSAYPNFPNLEILLVNGCHSLRNLISSAISFENLSTLHVSVCKGLKYLLTHSQAKSLTQLTKLEVESCFIMVIIVGRNEDDHNSGDDVTFRRLKTLKLRLLPRLQSFCFGNHTVKLPSLETLSISNRLKLKIFSRQEMLQTTNEEGDTDIEYWLGQRRPAIGLEPQVHKP